MRETKYKSGYIGKPDCLRMSAEKLLKGDTNIKETGSYPSASAPEFLKRRPYKKGGHVEAPRSKANRASELHIPGLEKQKKMKLGKVQNVESGFLPRHPDKLKKGGKVREEYKKGGSVKSHFPKPAAAKPVKSNFRKEAAGKSIKSNYPKPIIAGKHPMIGMKKMSLKLAGAKMPKVNKSVKAKQSQPYDASHGMYLKKGGKVK